MSRFNTIGERTATLSGFDSKHLAIVLIEASRSEEVQRVFNQLCDVLEPFAALSNAEVRETTSNLMYLARSLAYRPPRDFDTNTLAAENAETLAVLLEQASRAGINFRFSIRDYARTLSPMMTIADGEASETAAKLIAISEMLAESVQASNGDE